jgi:hypothetical protein
MQAWSCIFYNDSCENPDLYPHRLILKSGMYVTKFLNFVKTGTIMRVDTIQTSLEVMAKKAVRQFK